MAICASIPPISGRPRVSVARIWTGQGRHASRLSPAPRARQATRRARAHQAPAGRPPPRPAPPPRSRSRVARGPAPPPGKPETTPRRSVTAASATATVTEAVPSAMANVPATPMANIPICAVTISTNSAPVQGRIATAPISTAMSRQPVTWASAAGSGPWAWPQVVQRPSGPWSWAWGRARAWSHSAAVPRATSHRPTAAMAAKLSGANRRSARSVIWSRPRPHSHRPAATSATAVAPCARLEIRATADRRIAPTARAAP